MMMSRGIVFDIDGVLIDSYRAHFLSWQRLAHELGVRFTEDEFRASFGQTSREVIAQYFGDGSNERVEQIAARKEATFRDLIAEHLPAMDGAAELIESLQAAGFRLAIGSSAPPENVELVLDRLGVRCRFDVVISGRDVTRGKPDPQVFLLASERLWVPASNCVVIEDAPLGIEAAKAAGMAAVGVASTGRRPEDLRRAGASIVVDSLRELSVDRLTGLLVDRMAWD